MKEENVVVLTVTCFLHSQKLSRRLYMTLASEGKSGFQRENAQNFSFDVMIR